MLALGDVTRRLSAERLAARCLFALMPKGCGRRATNANAAVRLKYAEPNLSEGTRRSPSVSKETQNGRQTTALPSAWRDRRTCARDREHLMIAVQVLCLLGAVHDREPSPPLPALWSRGVRRMLQCPPVEHQPRHCPGSG
jgi:hypothetical protein